MDIMKGLLNFNRYNSLLIFAFTLFGLGFHVNAGAQDDDLDKLLDEELSSTTDYAMGTFFTTRIINGQSVQMMPKGGLDFRINHRFDKIEEGYNRFWGIDGSHSYLSLEYGFTDDLLVGLGRQNDAYFNGFIKYRFLKQSKGQKNMPITLTGVITTGVDAYDYKNDEQKNKNFAGRWNYTYQLLIGRMFSPKLSLQVSPTLVHRNMVKYADEKNDVYALGIGGRYKLTNTFSVNAEYYYVWGIQDVASNPYYHPVSIGVDIQVSGHVFQIMITNTSSMIEHSWITNTSDKFNGKGLRLGFNISQVFTIK